jgi:hypothetical protein
MQSVGTVGRMNMFLLVGARASRLMYLSVCKRLLDVLLHLLQRVRCRDLKAFDIQALYCAIWPQI